MKLVHTDIDTQFLNNGKINILSVESGKRFREFCESMRRQTDGDQGFFVLSEGDNILPLNKYGIYIFDYFDLDLSDKKYVSKLYARICSDSDSKFPVETAEVISNICLLLDKLNSESDIPFVYNEATPLSGVLKAFDVKPKCESSSFLESLITFIDAIVNLTTVKLFCFVNLKANLSDEETEQLYQYFHNAELFVFLLETSLRNKRDDELNVLIDNDLCEIVY